MPRKTYTEQFKRDAVSLYESTPGATLNAIASDLGVIRNSLRTWLDAFGTGPLLDAAQQALREHGIEHSTIQIEHPEHESHETVC